MNSNFDVPILFLIFNRPYETSIVFETIKKIKPTKFFISADGPRLGNSYDEVNIIETRNLVLNNIDWDCECFTNFSEQNLGCGRSVSDGISWFFNNVPFGIILEDDCSPQLDFFNYAEELLIKYENNLKIWHISGNSIVNKSVFNSKDFSSYYYSNFNHVWGWATWANRWKHYNYTLSNISETKFIKERFSLDKDINFWENIFFKMKNSEIDTWDYQWTFAMWYNNGVSIVPKINLIENIGFGENATHTLLTPNFSTTSFSLSEIVHPSEILINAKADNYVMRKIFVLSLCNRLKIKFSILLKSLSEIFG
jgi:hypothetical protein